MTLAPGLMFAWWSKGDWVVLAAHISISNFKCHLWHFKFYWWSSSARWAFLNFKFVSPFQFWLHLQQRASQLNVRPQRGVRSGLRRRKTGLTNLFLSLLVFDVSPWFESQLETFTLFGLSAAERLDLQAGNMCQQSSFSLDSLRSSRKKRINSL